MAMLGAIVVRAVVAFASILPLPRYVLDTTLEDSPERCLEVAVAALALAATVMGAVEGKLQVGGRRAVPSTVITLLARSFAGVVCGTVFFHVWAVLFGAPAGQMVWRTSLWAMVLSALVAAPGACLLGAGWSQWRRVMLDWHCRNDAERGSA